MAQHQLTPETMNRVQVLSHPIVKDKLSRLRNVELDSPGFRSTLQELSYLLALESTRDLSLKAGETLKSPMCEYQSEQIKENTALFPILRAGLGLLGGFQSMLPYAKTHHIGLYREKSTFLPVEYYNKLPSICGCDCGFVLDPMIATAGTAIAAVSILKDWGLTRIKFCAVVGSRDGLEALIDAHPDIEVYVCAVDEVLTDSKYIMPGLGDAGDRVFDTYH